MLLIHCNARFRSSVWILAVLIAVAILACTDDETQLDDADIAYVSANPPEPRLVSVQGLSLGGDDQPIAEAPRPDHYNIAPHFSPDGDVVAFERRVFDTDENVGRLFAVDLDDPQLHQRQLTDLGHDERCQLWPRGWSPDGESVGFVCVPVDNDGPRRIGIAELDGDARLLEPDADAYTDIRFDPDGRLVVLARDGDQRRLIRLDPDDPDQPDEIATFEDNRHVDELRVGPDGDRVALVEATDDASLSTPRFDARLLVVDLDDGQTRQLLAGDDEPTAAGRHSVQGFHPDGDELLVATGGFGHDPGPLRLIDVDEPTEQTTLAESDDLEYGTIRRADISADGDTVVFSDNDSDDNEPMRWSQGHLHLVETDGSDLDRLDDLSVPDQVNQPTFNPDL